MTHGRFSAAPRARTDRQMRLRDCSPPRDSEANQQSSVVLRQHSRCDSTPAANIRGSVLWQEQGPATQADIGFASSVTALRSFTDEIRMSNAFPVMLKSPGSPTSPALDYLPGANFSETLPAGARLLSAVPPRAPAVQGSAPERHSPAMP